jgi:hypothetical protein
MKYPNLILFIVLSCLPGIQGHAQSSKPTLDFMVGTWLGTGWKMMPTGKEETTIKEVAQCRLGCSMYIVDGLGTRMDINGQEQVVHEAFGVFNYNTGKGAWTIKAYTSYGVADSDIEILGDKKIRWKLALPDQSIVHYTIDFSVPNTWHEIGEMSRDGGATWMQIMEMSLNKQE